MGKRLNLIGQKFNKLTVIEDTNFKDSSKKRLWKCLCDCGNITYVTSTNLKRGTIKTCGCSHIDAIKKAAKVSAEKRRGIILNDITGIKFGELTAIKPDIDKTEANRKPNGKGAPTFWFCKCSCGSTVSVNYSNLINGSTKSCGCVKSRGETKIANILNNNNIKFEKQKWFDSCRFPDTNWVAYFDFYLPSYNLLIEYDGDQHFYSKGSGWNNEECLANLKRKDNFKNEWCKNNGIPLIRIPYTHYKDIIIDDLISLENNIFLV